VNPLWLVEKTCQKIVLLLTLYRIKKACQPIRDNFMNITTYDIPVPNGIMLDKRGAARLRALAQSAINAGLEPLNFTPTGHKPVSVFLDAVMYSKIEIIAERAGMSMGAAFAGLALQGVDIIERTRTDVSLASHGVDIPFNARGQQARFYQVMRASMRQGRICIAEGSTGIGKSRALVAAAIASARDANESDGPVVVAAPTLAVLGGSIWNEFEVLVDDSPDFCRGIKVRFYPGSTEFVLREKLMKWVEKHPEKTDPDVLAWIHAGAPCQIDTPLIRAMRRSGVELTWLAADLKALAVNMDVNAFIGVDDEDLQIKETLSAIRKDAAEADVILCTHAMLAVSIKSAFALFGKPYSVIIDEAHQLESIFSSVFGEQISLYSLKWALADFIEDTSAGKGTVAYHAMMATQKLIDFFGSEDEAIGLTTTRLDPDDIELRSLLVELKESCSSKKLQEIDQIRNISRMFSGLSSKADPHLLWVSYSPDRRYPSLLSGARSVSQKLNWLWSVLDGGGAMVSATLYTPDEYGHIRCDYIQGLLDIPSKRLDTPAPIIAPWVYSIPRLHTPQGNPHLCRALARPAFKERNKDPSLEIGWLKRLTTAIKSIVTKADGGTLILCVSFDHVNKIGEGLIEDGIDPRRIVMHSREMNLAKTQTKFMEKYGERPILIATGGAWTGINLANKDVHPSEDSTLRNLIITTLPIGSNQSPSMMFRVERQNMRPIIAEALMTLRQGMGRAVRSDEAKDVNIWFLDGRIWTKWIKMDNLQRSVLSILGNYKRK